MPKILKINSCSDCPHFKPEPIQEMDDSYLFVCNHPDLEEPISYITKIRYSPEPPPSCLLENYNSLEYDL